MARLQGHYYGTGIQGHRRRCVCSIVDLGSLLRVAGSYQLGVASGVGCHMGPALRFMPSRILQKF